MGANYDKARKLSGDPGVLYLAQVADTQQSQLDALKASVDACCGSTAAATKTNAPVAAATGDVGSQPAPKTDTKDTTG